MRQNMPTWRPRREVDVMGLISEKMEESSMEHNGNNNNTNIHTLFKIARFENHTCLLRVINDNNLS